MCTFVDKPILIFMILCSVFLFGVTWIACEPIDCCDSYTPETRFLSYEFEYNQKIARIDNDTSVFYMMCHSLMYTDGYDLDYNCKLMDVDLYIEKAFQCCDSLRAVLDTASRDDHLPVSMYYLFPLNSFTHCVMNTDPNTMQCDVAAAIEYEKKLNDCCSNAPDFEECARTWKINDMVCDNASHANKAEG